jgi:hypothetical protein
LSAINLRGSGFLSGTNALRFPRRFLPFFEMLFLPFFFDWTVAFFLY